MAGREGWLAPARLSRQEKQRGQATLPDLLFLFCSFISGITHAGESSAQYSFFNSHQPIQRPNVHEPIISCYRGHTLRSQTRADASPAPVARIINQKTAIASSNVQPVAVVMHRILIHFELAKLVGKIHPLARGKERINPAAVSPNVKRAFSYSKRGYPVMRQSRAGSFVSAHDSQPFEFDKSREAPDKQPRPDCRRRIKMIAGQPVKRGYRARPAARDLGQPSSSDEHHRPAAAGVGTRRVR